MGLCDPKAIRDGKSWADVVNKTPLPPHSQTVLLARAWRKKINDLDSSTQSMGSTKFVGYVPDR
jgi:hypothetical protein